METMTINESKGQKIGYVRVSTSDQNTARQLDGIELDQVFTDKLSGASKDRPQLDAMMTYARCGDVVIVHSMDRLARNLNDLHDIINELIDKGVGVQFKKENLTFSPSEKTNAMNMLLLNIMGAVAQFERETIKERQAEGIAKAKAKGVYKGRKKALTDIQVKQLNEAINQGKTKAQVASQFGVSVPTVYRFTRS